jgi:hypothetical protein
MDVLTRDDLLTLAGRPPDHCVSLFLPTRPGADERAAIRWKNLLAEAHAGLLARGLREPEARHLLRPARDLLERPEAWRELGDGLAAFLAPGTFRVFRLPRAPAERAVVSARFHVTPLLPLLAEDGRFFVLALSQKRARLLECSATACRAVAMPDAPAGLEDALRFHDTDATLTYHTRPVGAGRWSAIFNGHGVGIDDHKDDLLLYFRAVDRGLRGPLRGERAPLLLASVEYLWPIFRSACAYPHLLPEGLPGNPDRLSDRDLHERGWAAVRPLFAAAPSEALAQYARLAGTGRTAAGLAEVVREACRGRLQTLFLARDQERWGVWDEATGEVAVHERAQPGDEELLNLAALGVLPRGEVFVLPPKGVPGGGEAAGVAWLPEGRRG